MRTPNITPISLEAYRRDEGGRINEGTLSVNGMYVAMFDYSFADYQGIEAMRFPIRIASVEAIIMGHREVGFDLLDADLEPAMSAICYMKDSYVSTKANPRQGYFRRYANSVTEQDVQSFVAIERNLNVTVSVEELEQALINH